MPKPKIRIAIPTKNDYIRFALDGLRRVASTQEDMRWGEISQIGLLARFTDAISYLYEERRKLFDDSDALHSFIVNIARHFEDEDFNLSTCFRTVDVADYPSFGGLEEAFQVFVGALLERLRNGGDPVETAAFICFRIDIQYKFFRINNREISHAISSFVLMRHKQVLPIYPRDKSVLAQAIKESSKSYEDWVRFYRQQFRETVTPEPIDYMNPSNCWSVSSGNMFDPNNTIFQNQYVLRDAGEIRQLHSISGKTPKQLAVFRPSRMAMHHAIAHLVTETRMEDVRASLSYFIKYSPVYQYLYNKVLLLDHAFDLMAAKFSTYAAFLIDDHFNVLNPQARVREILLEEKAAIEARIKQGAYDPRTAESRRALRTLVA